MCVAQIFNQLDSCRIAEGHVQVVLTTVHLSCFLVCACIIIDLHGIVYLFLTVT